MAGNAICLWQRLTSTTVAVALLLATILAGSGTPASERTANGRAALLAAALPHGAALAAKDPGKKQLHGVPLAAPFRAAAGGASWGACDLLRSGERAIASAPAFAANGTRAPPALLRLA